MVVSGEEEAAASSVNGELQQNYSKQYSSNYFPVTLKFVDVSYRVKLHLHDCNISKTTTTSDIENPSPVTQHRQILNGITGMASPGHILAILGPSGSGKSTLLNSIMGRTHTAPTGTVLFNNRKLTKSILKRTGFVPQDDVFYPNLTVRETLVFCSLLRLPYWVPKEEKIAIAESMIIELGLSKCEHTNIGSNFIRGISGGERKRVSIGCEMLVDPSLLVLDEPTSGLDATAAYRVALTLRGLAEKGKTVVMSVHQPSSRMYQMFDDLLVLSEGECIYFGKGNQAMTYFERIGFSPSFSTNPADFLLDLANGVCQLNNASEKEKPNVRQALVSSYNNLLAPKVKIACINSPATFSEGRTVVKNHENIYYGHTIGFSNWYNQFNILLQRNLKERKHQTFDSLRVFQVITASLLAGLMWWRSDYKDIQDRLGLFFFISIFWGVFPSLNSVFAFPQERSIFIKERASGMYTLSSYFMARITGDLPMEIILPTLFLSITYWMTGLKPELLAFTLSMTVVLGYVLVSQGLGLAVGALIMDSKQASTVVTVTMLAFVLTGGYYVHKVPYFMSWIKYVSSTFYGYRLLINVQYGDGERVSSLLGCSSSGRDEAACKFVDEDIEGQIHPVMSVVILLIMFVGYRLLAYIALKRIRT